MVLLKINGQRNAGTNFLKHLLAGNFTPQNDIFENEFKKRLCYYWKHGVPCPTVKKQAPRVVDLFIFRRLDSWLVSMFKNAYHLVAFEKFEDFLTKPQNSYEGYLLDFRTQRCLNETDVGKTIFEIRSQELHSYLAYAREQPDVVLVSLEWLQDDQNLRTFLETLNHRYDLGHKGDKPWQLVPKHIKSGMVGEKNRDYGLDIEAYREIISAGREGPLEDWVDGLTMLMKVGQESPPAMLPVPPAKTEITGGVAGK